MTTQTEQADARATAARDDAVLVLDLALLTDSTSRRDFDQVMVVVVSPAEGRGERLMAARGLTLEQAWAEIDADTQAAERTGAADIVFENEGELEQLDAAVGTFWTNMVVPALSSLETLV